MAKKYNFYVVWEGNKVGIFNSWKECSDSIKGFAGAKYKGFVTMEEAESALKQDYTAFYKTQSKTTAPKINKSHSQPPVTALCVDAACSGSNGVMEYRGVILPQRQQVFHRGPFPKGTMNIGEFLAIVTGLAMLEKNNWDMPLYSDSKTAIAWIKKKAINSKLERTDETEELFKVIDKAMEWLNTHGVKYEIKKWETDVWGEIPADFGRK